MPVLASSSPRSRALAVAAVVATAILGVTACSSGTAPSSSSAPSTGASTVTVGSITVSGAYVNEPTVPERTGAFFTVASSAAAAVTLTGVSVPATVAKSASLHSTVMVDGVMQMKEVPGGLPVPAGGQLVLKPGGFHVMLMMPTVAVGAVVPLTLVFSDGTTLLVDAPVKAADATPSSASPSGSM